MATMVWPLERRRGQMWKEEQGLVGSRGVGEGAKKRQDNRGGGFLAMQEQRQDLL